MKLKNYLKQLFFLALNLYLVQSLDAQSLKSLAEAKAKYIGNIMTNGFLNNRLINNGSTDLIAKTEYNTLVAENIMKMDNLLRNRPANPFNVQISDINTTDIDSFIAYADSNGMRKRGHVMIWYSQIPVWLQNEAPSWTAQQVYDFSRSYILALSTYTVGKIDEWDVLNEAVLDNGYRTGTWYDIVNTQANNAGKMGYLEYFASLFKWARQGDPNALLFYNDFSVEAFGTNKNNRMRTMCKDLKNSYNAPINAVGLQSHFTLLEMTPTFITNVGRTIDDLGLSGFIVNLTELDIRICTGDGKTLEDQRVAYRSMVSTALSRKNCSSVVIWGISDNESWIPEFFPGCGNATPHDSNYQKKPAYVGIQEALSSLTLNEVINVVSGPVSVAVGSNSTIFVDYTATQSRDVVVLFQQDTSPYTTYQTVTTTVAAGKGTLAVSLLIPGTVPVATAGYQYQVFIAPVGGNWTARLDNLSQINVTTVAADTAVPSVVSALTTSNVTSSSLNLSWSASTDNIGIIEYRVFVNGVLNGSTTNTTYLVTGLSSAVSYSLSVVAVDNAKNQSAPAAITATTNVPTTSSIASVNGPTSVARGSTITLVVGYEASQTRDVVVILQQDSSPFTSYQTARRTVTVGNGTLSIPLTIPETAPIALEGYQYQVYITPSGGNFSNRLDNLSQINVTVTTPPIVSNGIGGGSWSAISTWVGGAVPTQDDDVTIVGSDVVALSGARICNNLTIISAAGSLTLTSGSLTVRSTILNNGTLTIENNANLIQTGAANTNSGTGSAIVKKNSNPLFRLDYSLWSSPVTGTQTLLGFSPLTSQLPNRFYEYAETIDSYRAVSSAGTFALAKGYLIRMPNTNPLPGYDSGSTTLVFPGIFTGVINNGYVPVTMTKVLNGYTAVGNPYPSVLDADTFIMANTATIESTLYFWRKTNLAGGSAYATYSPAGGTSASSSSGTPNGKIQVGQGFIVKAKNAWTIANFFTNAMRDTAPTSTQFFKTKQVEEKSRVWLNLTNTNGVFSQALIAYITGASTGVDIYDGKYINDSAIALTSKINNEEYTIQGRPTFDVSDVVELSFKTDVAGDFTIAIDRFEGIFGMLESIYLVDNKTGKETDLKAGAYNFSAAAGKDSTRFSLKYQKTLKVDSTNFNDNSVTIYRNNSIIYVNSGATSIKSIELFDIQGRLIAEQKNVNATTATIKNLKANHQVVIVKILGENGVLVSKKVVN